MSVGIFLATAAQDVRFASRLLAAPTRRDRRAERRAHRHRRRGRPVAA